MVETTARRDDEDVLSHDKKAATHGEEGRRTTQPTTTQEEATIDEMRHNKSKMSFRSIFGGLNNGRGAEEEEERERKGSREDDSSSGGALGGGDFVVEAVGGGEEGPDEGGEEVDDDDEEEHVAPAGVGGSVGGVVAAEEVAGGEGRDHGGESGQSVGDAREAAGVLGGEVEVGGFEAADVGGGGDLGDDQGAGDRGDGGRVGHREHGEREDDEGRRRDDLADARLFGRVALDGAVDGACEQELAERVGDLSEEHLGPRRHRRHSGDVHVEGHDGIVDEVPPEVKGRVRENDGPRAGKAEEPERKALRLLPLLHLLRGHVVVREDLRRRRRRRRLLQKVVAVARRRPAVRRRRRGSPAVLLELLRRLRGSTWSHQRRLVGRRVVLAVEQGDDDVTLGHVLREHVLRRHASLHQQGSFFGRHAHGLGRPVRREVHPQGANGEGDAPETVKRKAPAVARREQGRDGERHHRRHRRPGVDDRQGGAALVGGDPLRHDRARRRVRRPFGQAHEKVAEPKQVQTAGLQERRGH
mmetsp:Transcript_24282/g.74937  ORF Transcript_24282/g.74937 Transcript_24282/m.74937 type:complete len:528 (-) Transcript_24282:328-1911(-)